MNNSTLIDIICDLQEIEHATSKHSTVEGPQYWTPVQRASAHLHLKAFRCRTALQEVLNRRIPRTTIVIKP